MVASGDRLSPTEAAAETKLPLWNPRGMVAPGFFFVLLKDRTCLPLWGPQRASGTLPSGRSPLLRPSVLDAPHWGAGPEAAAETGVGTAREVTPSVIAQP